MITVHLYGPLAEQFGKQHRLDVSSPAEAVAALEANNPGKFRQALIGNSYEISCGSEFETGDGVTEDTLTLQRPGKDIHFVPVIEGGKGGIFQAVLGVVIAVVGYVYFPEFPAIGGFGVAMALGGVVQMLTPVPDMTGAGPVSKAVDPRKSFIFTGARNITTQGGPVPVIYGEVEVGSVVISQSLTSERA